MIAVVMVMASLTATSSAQAEAAERAGRTERVEKKDPADLTALRKEAEKSAKELEDATKALEKRRADIAAAEKDLRAKLDKLQEADRNLARIRQPVAQMAESLYQQPVGGDGVMPFLSGDASPNTLRAMTYATYMVEIKQQTVEKTAVLAREAQRLAAEAQEIRANNLLAEAQMAAEVDMLRQRSDKIVKSLTAALVKLGIKIDKVGRAALSCNPLRAATANSFPNGLIPKAMLCPLQQKGHSLRADAAIAFVSLNEAYRRRFGKQMCVTDAYRSLAAQQSVYYRRPGFAAVPGRSNHGLGLAVDLCGGVERYKSVEFVWMEQNSKKYGWFHPAWAYSSPFEPWHWEYDPKIDSLL
ncbi:D-alanyl-D-alanine carboxypeptidase family protein [Nonomuraea rhodomycinica]|uniref:D-alanyl-D-alanine carboxypeptidase family protein n=2 Tax=Nonomuraea rhodomycinica TaxID=1712872 RepID=A0A7Y6IUG1_9ACTN|nr:D-alanyl-D-alanine carboxypeptidase family protein [Nonomuraea rhodomycinica]